MKIKDITKFLESWAPPSYQESYDNSGLIIGNAGQEITTPLISLDVTEEVIDEAIETKSNLIIAHHPLIFRGVKRITGNHWVEKCLIKAIKNDIAIYAIHTNLDNVHNGVNAEIARRLDLKNIRILSSKKNTLTKLETFVPHESKDSVLNALYKSGVGEIGNYDHCSFQIIGTGTFRPNDKANPFLGNKNEDESVEETRIEVIFPGHLTNKVLNALKTSHPYEEVAYYLHTLDNNNQELGSGMIGELGEEMDSKEFLQYLKSKMNLKVIKHTVIHKESIKRVAVCGGSGSFLLENAKRSGADIFISSDFKYHDFFEAEGKIIIADIGHYESEVFTKDLIFNRLRENFANIAPLLSKVHTNPVSYL